MTSARISYSSLLGVTPEGELDALIAMDALVLECHVETRVAEPTGDRDEAKEVKNVGPRQSLL